MTPLLSTHDVEDTDEHCLHFILERDGKTVFYGPDESHLTELSLGTANASGTLTATATGLANGTYVWYAHAVSTVDGTPYAAESSRKKNSCR